MLEVFGVGGFVLEGFAKEFALDRVEEVAFREDYLEFKVKVAKAHRILVERHAQLFDGFPFFIFQYFSGSCCHDILFPI